MRGRAPATTTNRSTPRLATTAPAASPTPAVRTPRARRQRGPRWKQDSFGLRQCQGGRRDGLHGRLLGLERPHRRRRARPPEEMRLLAADGLCGKRFIDDRHGVRGDREEHRRPQADPIAEWFRCLPARAALRFAAPAPFPLIRTPAATLWPRPGPVAQWLEPAAHNGLVAGS